jgi:hypothetical protein
MFYRFNPPFPLVTVGWNGAAQRAQKVAHGYKNDSGNEVKKNALFFSEMADSFPPKSGLTLDIFL